MTKPPAAGQGADVALGATAVSAAPGTEDTISPGAVPPRSRPDYSELVAVDHDHYVFGEQIARGGMGRIRMARDRRLGRDVAIKEVLVNDPDLLLRFEREARITARLQHPSIISVHEAGLWPTGEPFFAMKLVSGRSFDRVLAEARSLEDRLALLPSVLAVAEAMAYSHGKGVIHRDLKPQNVLVGSFGEVVVIDWGLAKDLTSTVPDLPDKARALRSDGQTQVGAIIGTPAYMPPEQAAGESVDQRADVYALGALLYHLLSGRPPVAGSSLDEVLANVISGHVSPLAEIQPDVPPDLIAIVGKALAVDPGERYPSALGLAEDLRRYQTGQLVGAHRYSVSQLVRRWLRRHRTAATVGAVAALALIAIGVVSVRRIIRAEAVAESERKVAVAHRAGAEELTSYMLGDLRDKLEPIGKLDLLKDVAKKARAYYQQRPDARDPQAQRNRAQAQQNLADVTLAEGNAPAAISEYREALGLRQALVAADPGNVTLERDLSLAHDHIGRVRREQGDLPGALTEYRASMAIASKLAAADPTDTTWQRDLAVGHDNIGKLLRQQGDLAAAMTEHRTAQAIVSRLLAKTPMNAIWQSDLARAHNNAGDTLRDQGNTDAALIEYRTSLDLRAKVARSDRTNATWQRDLTVGQDRLAKILRAQGDTAGALVEYRAALAIKEKLASTDASNAAWQRDLTGSHMGIAEVLEDTGSLAAALAEYRAALAIAARLAATDPTNATWQRDLSVGHAGAGRVLQARADHAAAMVEFRAALAIRQRLAAADPSSATLQRDVSFSHDDVGDVLLAQGDAKGALENHRASLRIREKQAAAAPTNTIRRSELSLTHRNVGDALVAQGDRAAALAEYRAALAIMEDLAAKEPTNARWKTEVAEARGLVAKTDKSEAKKNKK